MSLDDIQGESVPILCDDCAARCEATANGIGWKLLVFQCKTCKQDCCPHLESVPKSLICVDCAEGREAKI